MTKREIILTVAIGFLVIFSIINYNKINELQQRLFVLDNLQHEVQNVSYSVQDVSSQVHTKLDEFLQEQLWISEKSYQINDINIKENQVDVNVEWSLRDLQQGENVVFLYREEGKKEWTELEVSNNNGLNYSLQHTFSLNENYETQILATSGDGQRSEELLQLSFKEKLDTRINIHAFLHPLGDGHYDLNIDIKNRLDDELFLSENREDLKIKSAKALLYSEGKLLKEWDLLENKNHHSDHYNEGMSHHDFLNIKEEFGDDVEDIELRVIVEDHLGLKYEKVAENFK